MTHQLATELTAKFSAPVPDTPFDARSGVLALFSIVDEELSVLLERRPDGPSRFSGHLSFPGGKIEDYDASPLAAALRETEEEIGVPPDAINVLGPLAETMDPIGRGVASFVATVDWAAVPPEPTSPEEVAELIVVPVASLLAPSESVPTAAYQCLEYECRQVIGDNRIVHYWELINGEANAVLWGFTGHLVAKILADTWGWSAGTPRLLDDWRQLGPRGPLEHLPPSDD